MAIGSTGAAINAILQKSVLSLIAGIFLTFIPCIIVKLKALPIFLKKFFALQPIIGCLAGKCLSSLHIYRFVFMDILAATAIILYSIMIIVLCFLIVPRIFCTKISGE